MTQPSLEPFERAFQASDVAMFDDLIRGIVGKKLSRWRETYAQGIVLDFGELVSKPHDKPRVVADRGEWTISTWGCDVRFADSPKGPWISDLEQLRNSLSKVVGRAVVQITITSEDLSMTLGFDNGSQIVFQTDRSDSELDQWFITTPSDESIGASASGHWYLRRNQ
jgi:hypothetical protein